MRSLKHPKITCVRDLHTSYALLLMDGLILGFGWQVGSHSCKRLGVDVYNKGSSFASPIMRVVKTLNATLLG